MFMEPFVWQLTYFSFAHYFPPFHTLAKKRKFRDNFKNNWLKMLDHSSKFLQIFTTKQKMVKIVFFQNDLAYRWAAKEVGCFKI